MAAADTYGNKRQGESPAGKPANKEPRADAPVNADDEDENDESLKVMMKKLIKVVRNMDKNVQEVKEDLREVSAKVEVANTRANYAAEVAEKTAGDLVELTGKVAEMKLETSQHKAEVKAMITEAVKEQCKTLTPAPKGYSKGSGKHRPGSSTCEEEEFKVKVIGFHTDTRKAIAEEALTSRFAKMGGFIEAFMPGGRNDFAFIKFDSELSRRRFMKMSNGGEFVMEHCGAPLRFLRSRTLEQTQKTKHIDKLRRSLLEAIKANHGDVSDEVLKEKVETGMNEGGIAWIGDVRIAEMKMKESADGGKEFFVDAKKITDETKKHGRNISGEGVVKRYLELMNQ
jgi:hypothetical protein